MKSLYPPSAFRPVFLRCQEVMSPDHRVTDILRTDQHTLVTIHPHAPTPTVVHEIAHGLDPTHELGWWITEFQAAIDLRALHTNPLGYLAAHHPALLTIPCLDHYIPRRLRTPWAKL